MRECKQWNDDEANDLADRNAAGPEERTLSYLGNVPSLAARWVAT